MTKSKSEPLNVFLTKNKADPKWRGGRGCATCAHQNSAQINAEIRAFAKAKAGGHEMPWSRFYRMRLTEVYGLKLAHTAITRHVRDCLGVS
jgi:hypothetical protein